MECDLHAQDSQGRRRSALESNSHEWRTSTRAAPSLSGKCQILKVQLQNVAASVQLNFIVSAQPLSRLGAVSSRWCNGDMNSKRSSLFSYYDKRMRSDKTIGGVTITEDQIASWSEEAEAGYDVAAFQKRGRGRPGRGAKPAMVVAVRLMPDELALLDSRAASEGKTRSQVIREALNQETA